MEGERFMQNGALIFLHPVPSGAISSRRLSFFLPPLPLFLIGCVCISHDFPVMFVVLRPVLQKHSPAALRKHCHSLQGKKYEIKKSRRGATANPLISFRRSRLRFENCADSVDLYVITIICTENYYGTMAELHIFRCSCFAWQAGCEGHTNIGRTHS